MPVSGSDIALLQYSGGTTGLSKGAIATHGGLVANTLQLLSWLVKSTTPWAGVASTGLTGGIDLSLTVIPFILRGVSLIGIDSVTCPMDIRTDVWRRLATDMKRDLSAMVREITLDGLPDAFATLASGNARGRFVVKIAPS